MKPADFQILPGEGIGKIKFLMTPEEVENILGKPDESYEETYPSVEEDEDFTDLIYEYDNLEMTLIFSNFNDKGFQLYNISTNNKDIFLNNQNLGNLKKDEAITYVTAQLNEIPQIQDDTDSEGNKYEIYIFEENGLLLQYDDFEELVLISLNHVSN